MPRTFVDRGGTFTDVVVLHDDGRVQVDKVPSDRAVVGRLAQGDLVFGTTVATNALLERAGVPTLLLVTQGFADLVRIGDMARPALFDADAEWPEPLCVRVVEVPGRLSCDGAEVEPLSLPELDLQGIQAVAVALLHSASNPAHELAVARLLEDTGVFVALGHQVSPERGYLARIETTLVHAAISPVLQAALDRDEIPGDALAMCSDGGLCPAPELQAPDAVLSGPAGGVVAVAEVARQAGFTRAVGLDMGGTSTDVCRVDVDQELPRREGEVRVAGVRLRRPMLEVHTIAAGGGSILRSDGLQLRVGPESAGADPGPACYGRGGPPTLTDAALALGLLDPDAFDPPLVAQGPLPAPAERFMDLAQERMAQAVRKLATARGVDLRDHALVAYGGAAGAHAARVAERLGISTVLVHPCAAVLSAWGQALARREASAVRSIWAPLTDMAALIAVWEQLERDLPPLGVVVRQAELRVQGTDQALLLDARDQSVEALRAAFHDEHLRRFGFVAQGALEVVNLRVRVRAPRPAIPAVDPGAFGVTHPVVGPQVLFSPTTAVHVPDGWTARIDRGLLRLDWQSPSAPRPETERTPLGAALWGARLMGVAEQAGEVLRRTARSVNIRERLDFSCAVFDGRGHLVANAPHIPVHLGAMGETVRDLIRHEPDLAPGQAWLTNDPAAGGSHLPDLTVVSAVDVDGERFFVASRGHHSDVGGLTPGSMPPTSTRLDQEGVLFRRQPLLDGQGRALDLDLSQVRQPDVLRADLRAQIASNAWAAQQLRELGSGALIQTWCGHLQDLADDALAAWIPTLQPGSADEWVGPTRVRVDLQPSEGRLSVRFSIMEGPRVSAGNLNAPQAVVRAAVLYVLRCCTGAGLPLNEGALRRVDIEVPPDSLLDPPPGAAVVGGNVETSQRLVDVLLRALGARASSQGTMNNLTLGGPGWSLYETIGGGVGASPNGPGRSGRQAHMTNTRITDVEVLETRLPLRVWRFAIRRGTGGAGAHPGGDGLIREIELLQGGQAALLALRDAGRPGLAGGGMGEPGTQGVFRRGGWQQWDGSPVDLAPQARVRVHSPGGGGWGMC